MGVHMEPRDLNQPLPKNDFLKLSFGLDGLLYKTDLNGVSTLISGSGTTDSYTDNVSLSGNSLIFDNNEFGSNFYNVDLSSIIGSDFTGNTSGNCITDLWVSNMHGCSPITYHSGLRGVANSVNGNGLSFGLSSQAGSTEVWNTINRTITIINAGPPPEGVVISGNEAQEWSDYIEINGGSIELTLTGGANPIPESYIIDSAVVFGGDTILSNDSTLPVESDRDGLSCYIITSPATVGFAFGHAAKAFGDWSHAEGELTNATGSHSHSEGFFTQATGDWSHSEGYYSIASGVESHAEGGQSVASGTRSHSEGGSTLASGVESHAEGDSTEASGNGSHAEGSETIASGEASHSEGFFTQAGGDFSHAGGKGDVGGVNQYKLMASGTTSFVHYEQRVFNDILIGAFGDNSSILGGLDHMINIGADSSTILGGDTNIVNANVLRSTVLGGSGMTATVNDTVYVPNLNIGITQVYADNTAASGLTVGDVYRTSTGVLMIRY